MKFNCSKCYKPFNTKTKRTDHEKECDSNLEYKIRLRKGKICKKCNVEIFASYKNHIRSCNGNGPRRITRKTREELRGKNYIEMFGEERAKEIIDKIRKNSIGKNKRDPNFKHTEDTKKKISDKMRSNPNSGGIRRGSGKGKKGYYKGYWCDSSWELAWVIYNIDHNIRFERNWKRFYYTFQNKSHYYIPDFYLIEEKKYVEIKGRRKFADIDSKCQEKIKSFEYPLDLLLEKDMENIINYVKNRYGKNYVNMYDN